MSISPQLLHTIRDSRRQIATQYHGLGEELDIGSRIRHSVQRKPWAWLGGAAITGVATAFLRRASGGRHNLKKSISSSDGTVSPNSPSPLTSRTMASGVGSVASAFLSNGGLWMALFEAGRWLFPLVRPALTSYATRKINALTTREHPRR